jgi:hypothetical protein
MSIVRTALPVYRTTLRRIEQHDHDYYVDQERYGYNYPYICHGCQSRLGVGQRYCSLLNTSNDYATWCESCVRQHGYDRLR